MKSKIASIWLILLLVLPGSASFLWLKHQKLTIRKEVKSLIINGIPKSNLICLKFINEELDSLVNWKNATEFEYQGQLYDIVESKINGAHVEFWCWSDHEETELDRQLDELCARKMGQNTQNRENQERLIQFYQNLYCHGQTQPALPEITHSRISNNLIENYQSLKRSPPDLPPKIS